LILLLHSADLKQERTYAFSLFEKNPNFPLRTAASRIPFCNGCCELRRRKRTLFFLLFFIIQSLFNILEETIRETASKCKLVDATCPNR
jgi:hypothetical protein